VADLLKESAEIAQRAILLYPKEPSANLVDKLLAMAEPEFLTELDAFLRTKHFTGAIRSERAKGRRQDQESAWLSPQVRAAAMALPARVPIGGGKTVRRDALEYAHIDLYLKYLDGQHRQRRENDAKRAAIEAIRKLWPRLKKRPRPMTLAEVDSVRAR
jgi:hypothetical protein